MKKLLPQANTLSTVIRTFLFIYNKENCTLDDIAAFNGFDKRQAAYYANACFFLDLIDAKLTPSELGNRVYEAANTRPRIYELIISHKLIGKLFAKRLFLSHDETVFEGKQIVKEEYPDYGDAVIDRRTRCLIGWCEEIISQLNFQK